MRRVDNTKMVESGVSIREACENFSKCLTFPPQFAAAAAVERNQHQTMLVVCPLQSIIDDQIAEARSMGMSEASVADISDGESRLAKFKLLFGSAEKQNGHISAYATN